MIRKKDESFPDGTIFTQQQTFIGQAPMEYNAPVMFTLSDVEGLAESRATVSQTHGPEQSRRTSTNNEAAQLASLDHSLFAIRNSPSQIPDFKELIAKMQAQIPYTERPQRKIFAPSDLNTQNSSLKAEHTNLYLALAATKVDKQEDFDPIYTYDLNGNRISMIDPTGITNYTYDALNRLTSVTNNKGFTTSFTYDALGRRTSMTHGNGVVTTYSYDPASQLTRLAHQLGAATINSFDYTYDRVGNRTSKTSRDGVHNYTYDTLNRLIEAMNPLPTNPLETYTYDSVGNRTNSNQNGVSVFNAANQLTEDGTFQYTYDNNGNLTRKTAKVGGQITSYEYDAENKLVRVVSNGKTVNYKYDGLGRRVEKEVVDVTTTTTRFIYDNEDILLELDGANNITARYTHGPGIDEPLVMEKGGASFFYHADGLGSITEISNQSGIVVQAYTYSSFGKIESQLDPTFIQPYTFTAREFDPETGLYFYQARYYDPNTGRFLQEDPILKAGNPRVPYLLPSLLVYPQMLQPYVYVANRPTKFVDPSGGGPILLGACIAGTALDLISTIRTLDQLERELEEIKKQIRKIESCPKTSDAEKLEKIKELQEKGFKITRKKVVELGKGSAIAIVVVVVCTAAAGAGP